MSSQTFSVLRKLTLPRQKRYAPSSGSRPFEWAIVMLVCGAFSFLLAGCSESKPSRSKTVASGSASAHDVPTARPGNQPQSTGASPKRDSGRLSKERSAGRKARSTAGTGSQSTPRRPFTPAEIEAAGRIYTTVQEKRESLLARGDSAGQNEERSMSGGTPASGLPAQMPQVQKRIIREMASAISEEPKLSPTRFRRLMNRTMRDSLLRDRFFEAIRKAGGESPSSQESSSQGLSPEGRR